MAASPRRLFLATIPDDFDPVRDLAIGPWCYIGREHLVPGWDEGEFVEPFAGLEARKLACDAVRWQIPRVVERIRSRLNRQHRRDYSYAYWHLVSVAWVARLVPAVWRSWHHMAEFAGRYADTPLVVEVWNKPETVRWDFADNLDFAKRGLRNLAFDAWLMDSLVRRLAPPIWQLVPAPIPEMPERYIPEAPMRSTALRQWVRRRLGRLRFADVPGAGPLATLALSALLAVKPALSPARPLTADYAPSPAEPAPPGLEAFLDEVVDATMPRALTDDFTAHEARAAAHRHRAGKLFVTGAPLHHPQGAFAHAHAAEAGERIVRVQHGTTYGTCLHPYLNEALEYAYSTNLTWGWDVHENARGRFIPMPTPQLLGRRAPADERSGDILMVCTIMSLLTYMLGSNPMPSQSLVYRRDKLRFLRALPAGLRAAVLYRPNTRGANDLDETGWLAAALPDLLRTLEGGELLPHLKRARLVVMDHPGTTLLETLAWNVPTLAFWNADAWPICDGARPWFDGLREAGILHDDPERAARHLAGLTDVDAWWHGARVQDARRRFCHRFARRDPLWWPRWAWTLMTLRT